MLAPLANFAIDYNSYNYTPVTGTPTAGLATGMLVAWGFLGLVLAIILIIAMWKVFVKAGRPGWAAIIPFYNTWVLAEIAGKPGWWGLYPLIAWVPVVGWVIGIIASVVIALGVAQNFGKSNAFGVVGLWLFSFIGYLILGFGSATYRGPKAGSIAGSPAEAPATLEAPAASVSTNKPKPPKLVQ